MTNKTSRILVLIFLGLGIAWTQTGNAAPQPAIGLASMNTNSSPASAQVYSSPDTQAQPLAPTPYSAECGPDWSVVSSTNSSLSATYIVGVAAVSSNDVWAVGHYDFSPSGQTRTIIEHWNGSTWGIVPSPNADAYGNALYGVAALSANDVWAVGDYNNGAQSWTLIEHWNGSVWSVWSSPNGGNLNNNLNGITAISTNDIWAVGAYFNIHGSGFQTLVEHWNGASWSVVASPSPGTGLNRLSGVAAISANDVWAVGTYCSTCGSFQYQTLVEHWDGSVWSVVPSPNVGTHGNELNGVAGVSASDVWAVGYYGTTTNNGSPQTLIEHWDGVTWSVVPSPNVSSSNALSGVASISASDVWAVGYYLSGTVNKTLVQHWNGSVWSVVPSPNLGAYGNALYGVAALSATDVWTMGNYYIGSVAQTLGEHWNGSVWSIAPSPNDGDGGELSSVAAISTNDVWAVGDYNNGSTVRTLTEHWDGTSWSTANNDNPNGGELSSVAAISTNDIRAVGAYNNGAVDQTLIERWVTAVNRWVIDTSPNASAGDNALNGVAMLSTSDIWAVGEYSNGAVNQTLIEHRDGSAWSIVTSPNVGLYDNRLSGVTAISANDVWAVGTYATTIDGAVSQTLVEHWDGSTWSVVTSPNVGINSNNLASVDAISGSNVWAVGYSFTGTVNQTLVEHWDGAAWSVVTSPNVGTGDNALSGVSTVSASNVWAVGKYSNGSVNQTLVEKWNGSTWSVVTSPNVGTGNNFLAGVAVLSAGDVWAVGNHASAGVLGGQTLVERFNPCTGTPTPTTTPTRTVTVTGTPATSTPTACALSFKDVPIGSTFYPYIQCMACRGIINGYPCGGVGEPCNGNNDPYFRPGNNVTRGQFAKITSNAAGFNEPTGARQYEDVLPSSTFYDFIWRLSNRGYINGYPCGGAGEPCGPSSLPYFRPNANVTRGQIAKIDANAAGYNDTPGAQQYEDVLPGSTFYDFIWRLADRGLVNGYPCGGAGEPCGPSNLPYFRPSSNATRGQASKIVANTFFPSCQTPANP